MTLNINQFAQTTVQGQMDLEFQGSVITCQVDAAQETSLIAGQAVKLATTGGGVPKVISLAADTDASFGFVARNLKDAAFPANSAVEIAMINSVMYMTAGAAITRGAKVEVVSATNKVITNAGTNPVVGFALDKASADGDLIRVYIITQSYQSAQIIADISGLQAALDVLTAAAAASVQSTRVTATLAEINAGKTLIAGASGKTITVLDYTAVVSGNFATGTAVLLQSSAGSPVVVSTIAEAALTTGAILTPDDADTTLGVGFAAPLGSGDALKVANSGSNQTVGTSITFTITYKQA